MPDVQLSAEAAAEWIHHVESILRGVGHGLNNRAAALGALVELADGGMDAGMRDLAQGEVRRVGQLARALLVLGDGGGAQAFAPADAGREALALLEVHRDVRTGVPVLEAERAAPVRVRRDTFLRALVALAAGTASAVAARRTLSIVAEEPWVTVEISPCPDQPVSPLVTELARAMDGDLLPAPRHGFRLPSLEAIRRREGR